MVQVSSPAKAAAVQRAAISGGRCAIDGLELNYHFQYLSIFFNGQFFFGPLSAGFNIFNTL